MRTFYEEWMMLSDNSFVETNKIELPEENSFVGTNKLPQVHFSIDADFPIAAFMSIGFSHHYAIVSKVKDIEQRKFYIQFAADTKAKVEDLEQLIDDDLFHHQGDLPNNFKRTIPSHLQAYRAITMFKDGPFQTSYLGQLAGYLRILDDEVRKPNENPSIGIILCKSVAMPGGISHTHVAVLCMEIDHLSGKEAIELVRAHK